MFARFDDRIQEAFIMTRTKLFISHSSKSKAAVERRDAIHRALERNGYEVFLDARDIQAGDVWRQQIHRMLAQCQAAVILFNQDAFKSPWVLKEATILAWRLSLERPDFQMLPIRLDDVETQDFKSTAWAPLNLTEVQHEAGCATADQVVAAVRSKIPAEGEGSTPYDRLVDRLSEQLEKLESGALMRVVEEECPDVSLLRGEAWRERFADLLARRIFEGGPDCLEPAVKLLAKIPVSNKEVRENIVSILQPLWVEQDAAAMLGAAQRRKKVDPGYRDLVLASSRRSVFRVLVAPNYVERAFGPGLRRIWPVADADPGRLDVQVVATLRDGLSKDDPMYEDYSSEELDEELRSDDDPFFVLLPRLPGPDELEKIRAAYDNVTYLIYEPRASGVAPPAALPPMVERVRPELEEAAEIKAVRARKKAVEFIG